MRPAVGDLRGRARAAILWKAAMVVACRCQGGGFRPPVASISNALYSYGGGGPGGAGGERGWGGGGGGDGFHSSPGLPAAVVKDAEEYTTARSEGTIVLDVGVKPVTTFALSALQGMSCGSCASSVKRILEQERYVQSASVNLTTETALVEVAEDEIDAESGLTRKSTIARVLAERLTESGYTSTVREASDGAQLMPSAQRKREERLQRLRDSGRRLAVAWGLAAACLAGHAAHYFPRLFPSWLHFLHTTPFHAALSVVALVGPGRKLLADGWTSLQKGSPNMNTLVGLGAVSSFGVSSAAALLPKLGWQSFFEEPVMLLAFVLLGRAVEERAKLQATSDMTSLLSLLPSQARLLSREPSNGRTTSMVATDSLVKGDRVVVLPGDRLPVDGTVQAGRSTVDESSITGEPMPVLKEAGSEVTAGTVNYNGTLTVEAKKSGGDTVLGDIVRMVEDAQTRAAPVQRFADQIAGKFCYGVMGLSAATFTFWATVGSKLWPQVVPSGGPLLLGLQLACNVLVIACPCALGLATPTAVLVGTGLGARRGLLIRGGDVLEKVSHIDTVVFDKTGTLTFGHPVVTKVAVTGSESSRTQKSTWEDQELLALAAGVERSTTHPVATAIIRAAAEAGCRAVQVEDGSFKQEPGCGATAIVDGHCVAVGNMDWVRRYGASGEPPLLQDAIEQGQTVVYVAVDGRIAGALAMMDELRPEAATTVEGLQSMGLFTSMLSGDKKAAAAAVAKRVGIAADRVHAGVRPYGKAEYIDKLQKSNKKVAMVGDGVNDAAALAQADVGITMAGGVGAASEVASIVLMGDKLTQVLDVIDLSKATFRKIQQNLGWAFLYNVVGIPIAAGALLPTHNVMLTPSIAAALMGVSSLGVMVNSLLLRAHHGHHSNFGRKQVPPAGQPG
eukprot:SM000025S08397  [mRNA]  locus=s25:534932:540937:- [translate_table: standard]